MTTISSTVDGSARRTMPAPPARIAATELTGVVDRDRPLTVEFSQYVSATALLMEELGGTPLGAPRGWRRSVTSTLSARDLAVLRPFVNSRPCDLPSCMCILPHRTMTGSASLEDDLERIAGIGPDVFAAQLPSDGIWDQVARNPGRWLHRFARAVRRACKGMREPWTHASGVFDREAERLGVAAVRGTERELIAARFGTPMWRLEGPAPDGADLRPRLGMVPMLGGSDAAHAWIVDGELTHIAYPLSDIWRLLDGAGPPPAGLEGLLGSQRALILRRLDRPFTAGRIAELLFAVPSAASHHIAILERAGLVARERTGRHVLVRRTARGTELLTLYDQS
jgi:DNA-binding transcriptional ArsR family regulator